MQHHTIQVKDNQMHYVEQGSGPCIVFLHGVPTSSMIWRNIIPTLSKHARCIAPDLIGMGLSDRPDISYDIHDHIAYFEAFLSALKIDSCLLVMHGLGSIIGFDYARRNPDRVTGLAFYESHLRPIERWDMLSLPVQQMLYHVKQEGGFEDSMNDNHILELFFKVGAIEDLPAEVMKQYQSHFSTAERRKPLLSYLNSFPLGQVNDTYQVIKSNAEFLCQTALPKCLLFAVPGFLTPIDSITWAKQHFKALHLFDLGDALHFAQESRPEIFANTLNGWFQSHILSA